MKSIYDAKINMFRTVAQLYVDYKPRFDVIPIFATLMTTYNGRLTSLEPWLVIVLSDPTVDAKLAKERKLALAQATEDVAMPTGAYAAGIQNATLQNTMDVRATYLEKEKKDRLPTISQEIFDEANAVKVATAPYGLTQDMLDILEDAIPAYESVANKPRISHGEVTDATEQVVKIIGEQDKLLEEQLDRIVKTFATSDPTLVSLWETARTIVDPQTTHTPFTLTIKTGNNVPIQNARCVLNKLSQEKVLFSNVSGVAYFPTISSGEWSVTVTADGFQPFFLAVFKIIRGEENALDVTLTGI